MSNCNSGEGVSLVILAAGLGKRFGGGKQLATIGRTGKPLMYFSVMDAWRSGIRRLVLVINRDIRQAVEKRFLPLLPSDLDVRLVEQRSTELPAARSVPGREKPWGTAHALWCAREAVPGCCIVINADDYYGRQSHARLLEHFGGSPEWAMMAFPLEKTLSDFGAVNRGLCETHNGYLAAVRECLAIRRTTSGMEGKLDGRLVALDPSTPVSMNIWGFGPDVFDRLERGLVQFFANPASLAAGEPPARS